MGRPSPGRSAAVRGWRELGWGSDAALAFWATERAELLTVGAQALIAFSMGKVPPSQAGPGPSITIESLDSTELMLDWLNEVNYRLTVGAWATWAPAFGSLSRDRLSARLDGFTVERTPLTFAHEVKAVTRHRPILQRSSRGIWVARVTLDL